jgi:uncharacterized membrane protein YhaH (DUF805 family)
MSAQMTADNPYSAPGAELGGGQSELYTPSIFSFNGRIGRLRYMAYGIESYLLLMLVMIPIVGTSAFMGGEPALSGSGSIAIGVISLAMLVAGVTFARRRLNDLNRSGWWLLLSIVPIVNLLFTIYVLFFPGIDGDNDFGPAPTANSLGVKILSWLMLAMFVLAMVGIVAAVVIPQFAGT